MAKIVDITDKLNFEDKPKIKVKDQEFEVDDSAVTMLKIMPKLSDKVSPDVVNELYEILFTEEDRASINALALNFKDFSTLVMSAITLVTGDDEDTGEAPTPVMT